MNIQTRQACSVLALPIVLAATCHHPTLLGVALLSISMVTCFLAFGLNGAAGLLRHLNGKSTVVGGASVTIEGATANIFRVSLLWHWLLPRGSTQPPLVLRILGLRLIVRLGSLPHPPHRDEGPDFLEQVASLDATLRSLHSRVGLVRPLMGLLWIVGFSLEDAMIDVADAGGVSLGSFQLQRLQLCARRVAGEVMVGIEIEETRCSWSPGGGFVQQAGLLRVAVTVPYPIDVRAVPPERNLLLPSSVVVAIPTITVSLPRQGPAGQSWPPGLPPPSAQAQLATVYILEVMRMSRWVLCEATLERLQVVAPDADSLASTTMGLVVRKLAHGAEEPLAASIHVQETSVHVGFGSVPPEEIATIRPFGADLSIELPPIRQSSAPLLVGLNISAGSLRTHLSQRALATMASLMSSADFSGPPNRPLGLQAAVRAALEVGEVRATVIMGPLLDSAYEARDEPPRHANIDLSLIALALRGNATATVEAQGGARLGSCSASVNSVHVDQREGPEAECVIAVVRIGADWQTSAGELKPTIQVESVALRWNPTIVQCFGTISGTIARHFYGFLFRPAASNRTSAVEAANDAVVRERAVRPLSSEAVDSLLCFDTDPGLLAKSYVVVRCGSVALDLPFWLWDHRGTPGDRTRDSAAEELVAVRCSATTMAVQSSGGLEPSIKLLMRETFVLSSGLGAWSHLGPAPDPDSTTCRFLHVGAFALEAFNDRIIELCLANVHARWTPAAQLRIFKLAREVTYSVWDTLLSYRCLKHADRNPGIVLNPPLDDVAYLNDFEANFRNLLASSGDKLHRLYAHNLHLEASVRGSLEEEVDVRVARLDSPDLPNHWKIHDTTMSICGHPTVWVDSLSLQRTLDASPTRVVGAALQELRARRFVVAEARGYEQGFVAGIGAAGSIGHEGFVVNLEGVSVRVGAQFDIGDVVSDQMVEVQALMNSLMQLPGRWIPDSPSFRRLFKSATTYEHILFGEPVGPEQAPEAWVHARDLCFSLADDPKEAWLERAYPLWLEDLYLRNLRLEQLHRRIAAVKSTHPTAEADAIAASLKSAHEVDNARIYIERANRRCLKLSDHESHLFGHASDHSSSSSSSKLHVSVDSVHMHLVIPKSEEDANDPDRAGACRRGRDLICSLDAAPPPEDALHDLFALAAFDLTGTDMRVAVRQFALPIFAARALRLHGTALASRTATTPEFSVTSQVWVDPHLPLQFVRRYFELPRIYVNLMGHVEGPRAAYSPAYEFGLEELASTVGTLYPSSMTLDPRERRCGLRWWDAARRLLTMSLDVTADGMELSLVPSFNSFGTNSSGIACASISTPALVAMRGNSFAATMQEFLEDGVPEQLRIECAALRLRYLKCDLKVEASQMVVALRPQNNPTALPLASLPGVQVSMSYLWETAGDSNNYHIYPILLRSGGVENLSEGPRDDDIFRSFRSHGMKLTLSARVCATAEVAPHFQGDCAPLFSHSHRSPLIPPPGPIQQNPVFCLYGSNLGELSNWAIKFKRIPYVPFPARCRPALDSGIWGLKTQIKSIDVVSLGINDPTEFLFLDEPNSEYSKGVRFSFEGLETKLKVSEEHAHPNPFVTGRLSADPDDPSRRFIIHDVVAEVNALEGRIMGGPSGGADEELFLFSAASLVVAQSQSLSDGVSLEQSLGGDHESGAGAGSSTYGDPSSYLFSATLGDLRLCLTVAARDALLGLGEYVAQHIFESLPDFDRPRADLLEGPVPPAAASPGPDASNGASSLVNLMAVGQGEGDEVVSDRSGTPQGRSSVAVRRVGSNSRSMGGLFIFRCHGLQVQVLDREEARACAILACGAVVAQGWIGAGGPDSVVTGEALQRLVRRELPQFVETVSMRLESISAFSAPTDLDETLSRGRYRWLPDFGPASFNGTSYDAPFKAFDSGVFRCLLAPGPAIEASVVIEHGAVPIHELRVMVPQLRFESDSERLRRVIGVLSSLSSPLPERQSRAIDETVPETAEALRFSEKRGATGPVEGQGAEFTVAAAWQTKQAAQWEVHRLRAILGSLQLCAAGVGVGAEDLTLLREGRDDHFSNWIEQTKERLFVATLRLSAAAESLGALVKSTKTRIQIRPHLRVRWSVQGVQVNLVSEAAQSLAVFELGRISGLFAHFLDWSGVFELDIHKFEAHFRGGGSNRSTDPTEEGGEDEAGHAVIVALDESEVRRIKSTVRKGGLGRELHIWNGRDPMVRLQADLGAPVVGVTPVKHFEITLVPLVVNLSRRAIWSLVDFFTPPDDQAVRKAEEATRGAFLPRAAPSQNKTAAPPLRSGLFGSSTSLAADKKEFTLTKRGASADAAGCEGGAGAGARDGRALLFGSEAALHGGQQSQSARAATTAAGRSDAPLDTAVRFQYLRLGQILVFLSYRGDNWAKLEDFDSLFIKVHPYIVRNTTRSLAQLAVGVRNHVVVDILSQVNRNFVNIGAFLATKFKGMALCSVADWSASTLEDPEGPGGPLGAEDEEGEALGTGPDGATAGGSDGGKGGRELLFGRAPTGPRAMGFFKR